MNDWLVVLVPKRPNGRHRYVRVEGAPDWDEALVAAEEHVPGWDAIQGGPYIEGAAKYLPVDEITYGGAA